jgi:predicted transcriptional regulator
MKHGWLYFNTISLVSSVLTITAYFVPDGASGVLALLSRDVPLWVLFLVLAAVSIILSLVFRLNRKDEKHLYQQLVAENKNLTLERDRQAADCQNAQQLLVKYQGQEDLADRLDEYTRLENQILSHLKGGLSKSAKELAELTGRDLNDVMLALHALGERVVGGIGFYRLG